MLIERHHMNKFFLNRSSDDSIKGKQWWRKKIALVTGANRGIGLEISRQLAQKGVHVILTARNQKNGENAVRDLESENLDVAFQQLDITNQNSVIKVTEFLASRYGKLDILVNNAGIIINSNHSINTSKQDFLDTLTTNLTGPFLLSQSCYLLLTKSDSGKIINMSSGMGALTDMGGTHTAYRVSKTALNALTATMAADVKAAGIEVFAMCPGWVKTRLGGDSAPRSVEEAAITAVWLAMSDEAETGKFYRDKCVIDW